MRIVEANIDSRGRALWDDVRGWVANINGGDRKGGSIEMLGALIQAPRGQSIE